MAVIHCVCAVISRKVPITVSHLLQEALNTEQQCVKIQVPIDAQKEQKLDKYLMWRNTSYIQK